MKSLALWVLVAMLGFCAGGSRCGCPRFIFFFNGKRAIWISNSVYIDAYVSVSNFTHSSRNQKEDHSEPRAVPDIYILI